MDVQELIDDREKDIHEVDDILLCGWKSAVVMLEHSVQAVTKEETEKYKDNKDALKRVHANQRVYKSLCPLYGWPLFYRNNIALKEEDLYQ